MNKDYEYLDQMWCMKILQGHGLGKNLQRLLKWFWEGQEVVPRSRGCYRWQFIMERGVTQGEPVSPTIFNIVVNVLVWSALLEVCVP